MKNASPTIDKSRLRRLVEEANRFGFNGLTGGHNRPGYSDADMAVRDWFAGEMMRAGLVVSRDGVNNIFGRYGPADGPCIMVGSHLDTVPEGGAFDGVLGACAALECVLAMQDADVVPKTGITVVATAEEEGRFGGMLGSQTITGAVTPDWLEQAADSDGISLVDAMQDQGLDARAAMDSGWQPGSIKAFLELHIEQGPVLEGAAIPIGIVNGVSGVCNLHVRLDGIANHSGTTPMDMRADAFAGLALFANTIPELIETSGTSQSRITIGKVDLIPNTAHTIPGTVEFSIILRDTSEEVMRRLRDRAMENVEAAARSHRLDCAIDEKSWLPPVALDPALRSLLRGESERLGLAALEMPSGAGHDAQTMQAFCPSGLIFVPSRGGISHSPQEWSDWADMEKGAQLMLNALCKLAGT
ncbi:MAG: Zn-dependent hydrolase [Rhizobiaceae bacterium]|nr:Zn-dependent hydrolase [Rhizobiaceae bacterium]